MNNKEDNLSQALITITAHVSFDDQDVFNRYVEESFVIITWPESQELMEEPWFEEEAILCNMPSKYGSSAYFVPLRRIF